MYCENLNILCLSCIPLYAYEYAIHVILYPASLFSLTMPAMLALSSRSFRKCWKGFPYPLPYLNVPLHRRSLTYPPNLANVNIALPQCPSSTPQVYTYPHLLPQKTHTLSGAEAGLCARGHSTFFCIRRSLFQTHILNPHVTRELSS